MASTKRNKRKSEKPCQIASSKATKTQAPLENACPIATTPRDVIARFDEGVALLRKSKTSDRIVCQLCQLVVSRSEIERHVYTHAGAQLPLFSCGYCSFLGAHVKNHHSSRHCGLTARIGDNRTKFAGELARTWNQCFADKFPIEWSLAQEVPTVLDTQQEVCIPSEDSEKNAKDSLSARTWTERIHLYISEMRSKAEGTGIYCKLCKTSMRKGDNRKVYIHILTHIRQPVFFCKLCSYQGNHILPHMRTNHRGHEASFGDRLAEMENQLIEMCFQCYGMNGSNEAFEKGVPLPTAESVQEQRAGIIPSDTPTRDVHEIITPGFTEHLNNAIRQFGTGQLVLSCELCGEVVEQNEAAWNNHILYELDRRGPTPREIFMSSDGTWTHVNKLQESVKVEMLEKCFPIRGAL